MREQSHEQPERYRSISLRPLERGDHAAVRAILEEPGVARWWGPVVRDLADELEAPRAILVDGAVAGFVDIWQELEPSARHAGLDIVLSEPFQDRGIGRRALALAARIVFGELGHHRITIDPAAANERAIRAYAAVGFRPVGIMRSYERGQDGTWHDNLLMDMLADELVFEFS
ncbi:MAG: GNAT family N-acetyltransferase [Solirubrobacteraceae bacterium]